MTFTFAAPPPELASTVKTIWVARGTKAEFAAPDPIVPAHDMPAMWKSAIAGAAMIVGVALSAVLGSRTRS